MKTLIYTQPNDAHALLVQLALGYLGHEVLLWFNRTPETPLTHAVSFDAKKAAWKNESMLCHKAINEFDVVWYRRARRPQFSSKALHPNDRAFALRENNQFYEAMTFLLSTQSWWINSPSAARRAHAKLFQLQVAQACGLMIPITLCSNSPQDIRHFFKRYQSRRMVYKPLFSSQWVEGKHIRAIYTTLIESSDLPDDETLKLTPGLFQVYIEKKYELRVTCFGSHCVAVKIDSQQSDIGKVDWRAIPGEHLSLSYYVLPYEIEHKIQSLMRRMGLMFGCIDIIVTPKGEYVFLEINEQGQFLWIEELDGSIRLLDRFIRFLLNQSFYFEWQAKQAHFALKDYAEALRAKLNSPQIAH